MTLDLGLILQVGATLVGLGGLYGMITVKIDKLEKKQDKHNGLIERMVVVEQSTKSAHHRQDEIVEQQERHWQDVSGKLDSLKDLMTDHVKEFHVPKN